MTIDIYDKEGNIIHSNPVPTNCMNSKCPYIVVFGKETHHYGCKKGYEDYKECEENE